MGVPHISRLLLGFFRVIVRTWFWVHFEAVLVGDVAPLLAQAETTPLIVYGNHSSWWDPMIAVLLAEKLMRARRHYAPMDAAALKDQKLLQRIGIFPVELHTTRGAKQFMQNAGAILTADGVLWVTPQGRFADTREVALAFKPGLATLATRLVGGCTLVPLATEYGFWNRRRPVALAHFGEAVRVSYGESKPEVNQRLEGALGAAMDELKDRAMTRDPAVFTQLPLWSGFARERAR